MTGIQQQNVIVGTHRVSFSSYFRIYVSRMNCQINNSLFNLLNKHKKNRKRVNAVCASLTVASKTIVKTINLCMYM